MNDNGDSTLQIGWEFEISFVKASFFQWLSQFLSFPWIFGLSNKVMIFNLLPKLNGIMKGSERPKQRRFTQRFLCGSNPF